MSYSNSDTNNLCKMCGACSRLFVSSPSDWNLVNRNFPHSCWDILPPGCGYEGWQFEQKEYHKKLVRKLKESLYELDFLNDNIVYVHNKTVLELKKEINDEIQPYKKYGADNW